jgi:hypothetical protein
MAENPRQTGPDAASAAGRTLGEPDATPDEKSAAASTLDQVGTNDQTSPHAASAAGRTLRDPDATQDEQSASASALSQTPNRKE